MSQVSNQYLGFASCCRERDTVESKSKLSRSGSDVKAETKGYIRFPARSRNKAKYLDSALRSGTNNRHERGLNHILLVFWRRLWLYAISTNKTYLSLTYFLVHLLDSHDSLKEKKKKKTKS
jgi:hypothetical protein